MKEAVGRLAEEGNKVRTRWHFWKEPTVTQWATLPIKKHFHSAEPTWMRFGRQPAYKTTQRKKKKHHSVGRGDLL